ncbi:MAG: hypothetical protein LBM99_00330 [Bacillales bacterium]|jgi:hypothetical protein|nr:hypothetical protein [Bacillales bacterium]
MKTFIKYLFCVLFLLFFSLLLWLFVYERELDYLTISDSLFVPSVIVFFMGLVLTTGSLRITLAFRYTFLVFFNRKNTKEKYQTFKDYYDDKKNNDYKKTIFMIYTSLVFLLVALIFAILAMTY